MHHCLFDVFWLLRLFFCRLWHTRYSMVRGHICMLQRNRDIYYYYYDYYFQYNTQRKLIARKPNLRRMNFEISLGSIYFFSKSFYIICENSFAKENTIYLLRRFCFILSYIQNQCTSLYFQRRKFPVIHIVMCHYILIVR